MKPSFVLVSRAHLLLVKARLDTFEVDWEGMWFAITARICPNALTFENVDQYGWEHCSDMAEPV